ncbi:hypothetical protein NDU88_001218 [Pleurodeles waltl]|uniref:Uncharacterized protein n=1 Tax=Pleurodeles waltl TaxID=8319 RepID=A0AAV7LX80_PLEWA|nr:hypothetical protein NDU88_001218 [Pleurodeles waltl]
MPPVASGRELLVGAAAPGAWCLSVPPRRGANSALGFRAPHRYDHAAAPLHSPNVALWVAASSLHQFGVSDCRDRLFEDAATAPNTVQGIASVGIEFDGVFGIG